MAARPPDNPLESWKEIAAFLKRDVRTVQRWEKSEHLPVHRHQHDKLGSVYAYPEELERWRRARSVLPADDPAGSGAGTPAKGGRPRLRGRRPGWLSFATVLCAGLLLGGWLVLCFPPGAAQPRGRVAVMPFTNLGGGPDEDYFSAGVTEEIVTQLNKLQSTGARVTALGSPLAYGNRPRSPDQLAKELQVGYVLEGSVRRSGDRVRLAVHLLRARDESHLWDESYDTELRDILSVQRSVAETIARNICRQVEPPKARPAKQVNDRAYVAFLKGRHLLNKRDPASLAKAILCFQEAVSIDGSDAPSFVGLADCYALLGSAEMAAMAPNEAMPLAKAAVARALALDPDLAEAHASLAHIKLIYEWDWEGAEREFRDAIRLNPGSATAHQWFARYQVALGRTGEALAELKTAERLSPLSPTVKSALAETYYFGRRYREAEEAAKASLELEPDFLLGLMNLGRALAQQGRPGEAVEVLKRGWERSGRSSGMAMFLGCAYARQGNRGKARELLEALERPPAREGRPAYVPALYVGALRSALGEREAALAALEKALAERCEYLIYVRQDPMADSLRGEPRFRRIVQSVGVPPQ